VFLAAAPPGPGRITRHHLRAGGEEVINKMSETLNSDATQVPDSLGAKLAMLRTLTADLAQQDWASRTGPASPPACRTRRCGSWKTPTRPRPRSEARC
jgi:hypothetical protein